MILTFNPQTLSDPEIAERLEKATADLISIEAQLAKGERRGDNGRPLEAKAFREWKAKATHALATRRVEIVALKGERRRRAERLRAAIVQRAGLDPNDVLGLLAQAAIVLQRLQRETGRLRQPDLALLDSIGEALRGAGPASLEVSA